MQAITIVNWCTLLAQRTGQTNMYNSTSPLKQQTLGRDAGRPINRTQTRSHKHTNYKVLRGLALFPTALCQEPAAKADLPLSLSLYIYIYIYTLCRKPAGKASYLRSCARPPRPRDFTGAPFCIPQSPKAPNQWPHYICLTILIYQLHVSYHIIMLLTCLLNV